MACTTGIGGNRPPAITEKEDTLKFFLCRACRYLSKEQLESIVRHDQSEFSDFPNQLIEWYRHHLRDDFVYEAGHDHSPEKGIAKKELERIALPSLSVKGNAYPY